MTHNLQGLPIEVLSGIVQLLNLADIARLRQTCRSLQTLISSDRKLWAFIIRSYVYDLGARLPLQIEEMRLHSIDTATLEFWARTSLTLNNTYNSSDAHSVFSLYDLPYITWVKLLRGRWCLVASSDGRQNQSQLSVYDGLGGLQSSSLSGVFYFDGPVMDGVVEDTPSGINIALSIGTSNSYIKIVTLCTGWDSSSIQLLERAIVSSAYETRFLHGNLVGFAVSDGDDSLPHVANWTSGEKWALIHTPQDDSPENVKDTAQATCEAMTIFMDHIVVASMDRIEFYVKPSSGGGPKYVSTLHLELPLPARSVTISSLCATPSLCWSRGHGSTCRILCMLVYDTSGRIHFVKVSCLIDGSGRYHFTLAKHLDALRNYLLEDDLVNTIAVGSSSSAICVVVFPVAVTTLPAFYMARIRVPLDFEDLDTSPFVKLTSVTTSGFPLLHMSPCIDFDDGRGVALIGNSLGELSLVEFEGGGVSQRLGIDDSIPTADSRIGSQNLSFVSTFPVDLDLPPVYKWLFDERTSKAASYSDDPQSLPEHVRIDCIARWHDASALLSMLDWSSDWLMDWSKFDQLQQWFAPVLLWDNDSIIHNKFLVISRLRDYYGILGEPIPLLFDNTGQRVIFKVGQKYYLLIYDDDGGGTVEDIVKLQLPLAQIHSGEVTRLDVDDVSMDVAVLYSRVLVSRDKRWHVHQVMMEFTTSRGFREANGRPNSWSQETWNTLFELWKSSSSNS